MRFASGVGLVFFHRFSVLGRVANTLGILLVLALSGPMPAIAGDEAICGKQIDHWADQIAKEGKSRTANIYWPLIDNDPEILTVSLYTPLHIDCEEECKPEKSDFEMYAFARSTHYWPLHEVFDVHINCEKPSMAWLDEPQLSHARDLERTTELAKIEMSYDPSMCKFTPSAKIQMDGCISIKVTPR